MLQIKFLKWLIDLAAWFISASIRRKEKVARDAIADRRKSIYAMESYIVKMEDEIESLQGELDARS